MSRPRSVVLTLLCLLAAPVVLAQDFYEQQLQNGKTSFAAGKALEAVTQLRIAAFGFLDRPPLLTQALIHLAVAQDAIGHKEEVTETIDRFMIVEQRFGTYAGVQVDPEVGKPFERLVLQLVPRATVAATPSLARLVRSEVEKVADLPVERRMAAYEGGFRKDSRNIQWPLAAAREAANRQDFDEMIRWGTRALALDRENKDALAVMIRARTAKRQCRESLALLSRFNSADFESRAALRADQFVCLAEAGKVSDAEPILDKVPETLRNRPDVVAAASRVSDMRRSQTSSASPSPAVKPPQVSTSATPKQPVTRGPGTSETESSNPSPRTTAPTTATTTTQPAAPKTNPAPVPATASSRAPTSDDVIAQARALVRQRKFTDAVRELNAAVARDATNRALRLALLEAAALAKDWPTAAGQLQLLSPLARGEELYMFYASMTMYETGNTEDAKPLLERARPRIVSSPLVEYYVRAILGRS